MEEIKTLEEALVKIDALKVEIEAVKENNEVSETSDILRSAKQIKKELIEEAKAEAAKIISDAKEKADNYQREIIVKTEAERDRIIEEREEYVTDLQEEISAFQDIQLDLTERLKYIHKTTDAVLKNRKFNLDIEEILDEQEESKTEDIVKDEAEEINIFIDDQPSDQGDIEEMSDIPIKDIEEMSDIPLNL